MPYEVLTCETDSHIATVTLNRPESLNALNQQLRQELFSVCQELYDDDDIRAIVLTGAGRGFCSGNDLLDAPPTAAEGPPSQNSRLDDMNWMGEMAMTVYQVGKPTIAAMNGVAAGAGMSLALACDMRVGSPGSRFKTVFAERGISPDSGMSYFLPRIVGYARAADLFFTSRDVAGEEAYRLGLLDRLVEPAEVLPASLEVASQIAALPPMAIRAGKRVLQQNQDLDFQRSLQNEVFGLSFARRAPHDMKEQHLAFVEKRKPEFTGD